MKYAAALRAESLRLAEQSHSVAAAAHALNIRAKLIYDWQQAALTPAAVAADSSLDAATGAELRQLRADNRRQAQELTLLKKALAIFSTPPTP